MRQELICITCPMGCRLVAERTGEGELVVSGNRCPRGAAYAREELFAPKRTVTATCRVSRPCAGDRSCAAAETASQALDAPRRVPVRTSAAFPKDRVPELLARLYELEVELPVERGAVVLADALGTGIDVLATRSLK